MEENQNVQQMEKSINITPSVKWMKVKPKYIEPARRRYSLRKKIESYESPVTIMREGLVLCEKRHIEDMRRFRDDFKAKLKDLTTRRAQSKNRKKRGKTKRDKLFIAAIDYATHTLGDRARWKDAMNILRETGQY